MLENFLYRLTVLFSTIGTGVVALLLKVVLVLVVYYIGRKVIVWLLKVIDKAMNKHDVDKGVQSFTKSIARVGLYILLIMWILSQFGIQASSIAALLASAGIAIGLALQGSLANFAGGIIILILKPFIVGDYISIQSGSEGTVHEISIFFTTLITVDNKAVMVPNGNLANGTITNLTKTGKRQLSVECDIAYDADLLAAKKVLEELLNKDTSKIEGTETVVFIDALKDSGVTVKGRVWVSSGDYWPAKWRLTEDIKLAFDKNGISIPYPHMDVAITQK